MCKDNQNPPTNEKSKDLTEDNTTLEDIHNFVHSKSSTQDPEEIAKNERFRTIKYFQEGVLSDFLVLSEALLKSPPPDNIDVQDIAGVLHTLSVGAYIQSIILFHGREETEWGKYRPCGINEALDEWYKASKG